MCYPYPLGDLIFPRINPDFFIFLLIFGICQLKFCFTNKRFLHHQTLLPQDHTYIKYSKLPNLIWITQYLISLHLIKILPIHQPISAQEAKGPAQSTIIFYLASLFQLYNLELLLLLNLASTALTNKNFLQQICTFK